MRALAVLLCALIAAPPGLLAAAATTGTVSGVVTVDGRPLSGLDLSLVDLKSGSVTSARSGDGGAFAVQVGPGTYVITGGGGVGLSVGRAPAVVRVEAGRIASTNVELVAMATASLAAVQEGGGAAIQHDAIGCMIAGEFPQLDAAIQPAPNVVRARLYFRSALSEEWYFTEMVLQPEGVFRGWMPRPNIEASPISYYILATTTDFGETQTLEVSAIVVNDEFDCEDKAIAATGQPPPGLTVFSATTGAAAIPVGFAAGGALLGTGALILLGALLLGGVAAATVPDDPTPTPTPPPPTTVPTPTPTPTPLAIEMRVRYEGQAGDFFVPELGTVSFSPDVRLAGFEERPTLALPSDGGTGTGFVPGPVSGPAQVGVSLDVNLAASPADVNVGPFLPGGSQGILFSGWGDDCDCGRIGGAGQRVASSNCFVTFDFDSPGIPRQATKTCTAIFSAQVWCSGIPDDPPGCPPTGQLIPGPGDEE